MVPEQMFEIYGTPDEIQAQLNFASKVEPAIYRKQRVTPGHYRLWYRSKNQPNDLVRAIKQRAGLIKPKRKSKPKNDEVVPLEQLVNRQSESEDNPDE